jgi:hypothetical protein
MAIAPYCISILLVDNGIFGQNLLVALDYSDRIMVLMILELFPLEPDLLHQL